jgi:phage-related tail fiber protein
MAVIDRRGATVSAADPPVGTNPNPDLAWKAPVRVATTGSNIALAGLQTIDGVALAAGDRVLVKDQTNATTNGLYNAATGVWTRSVDASNNSQWAQGTMVLVTQGAANAGGGASPTLWVMIAANPIVLGTSALTWRMKV